MKLKELLKFIGQLKAQGYRTAEDLKAVKDAVSKMSEENQEDLAEEVEAVEALDEKTEESVDEETEKAIKSLPNSLFNSCGSMPAALSCTGLRISIPASIRSGMSGRTAPQV